MLAENFPVLTRTLFGRRFISSRGNNLFKSGTVTAPLTSLTSTKGVWKSAELRFEVFQFADVPVVLCGRSTHTSHSFSQYKLFHHRENIFQKNRDDSKMPSLKGKRSESFRELILGKKKDKKDKKGEEEKVNGDLADSENHEETASQDPGSPGSTTSDPVSKDVESNIVENGEHEEEEEVGEASPEAEEPTEEAAIEEEPEPEPEPEGGGIYLETLIKRLEKFAPLSLAEDWDNVGLLVEPAAASEVKRVFLTNDLTEAVLEEAVEKGSNFILSYHPPIFTPLQRLTSKSEKERIVLKAIERGIAIYSPHTAHDAVKGGVNDWLLSAFGEQDSRPVCSHSEAKKYKLEVSVKKPHKQKTASLFTAENGSLSRPNAKIEKTSDHLYHFRAICSKATLVDILTSLNEMKVNRVKTQITKLFPDPCGENGAGRYAQLKEALTLEASVAMVKEHLGLEHVQLALGKDKSLESTIESVAVCAGSGGKVLAGSGADLYLTGEMSHHEVLAAVAKGTSVILCNHSNSERGYLKELKSKMEDWFVVEDLVIHVSEADTEPLKVV